jgi:ubiquitin-protein ligase E3 C
MIPIWGDERRRPINLGGTSSASSHTAILDQAKARRLEREDNRRRELSAIRVQAWWRGVREAEAVRGRMRDIFWEDVRGIRALRCMILVGRDEEVLGGWSAEMVRGGERKSTRCILDWIVADSVVETLFMPATGPDQASWLVLIRQTSLLLLQSVADSPQYKSPQSP